MLMPVSPMIFLIWVSLAGLTAWFLIVFVRDLIQHKGQLNQVSWLKTGLIGFVVNFFDVLGIGAFAPQTTLLKFTRLAEDREIPGTLNVSNALPVLLQALIFITVIEVEPVTLILLLVSAAGGAVLGAGIVAKLPERKIRLTIGVALLVTAFFMFAGKMNWVPGGGEAIGLEGTKRWRRRVRSWSPMQIIPMHCWCAPVCLRGAGMKCVPTRTPVPLCGPPPVTSKRSCS